MGFLDKLFGENSAEVVSKMKEVAGAIAKEVESAAKTVSESIEAETAAKTVSESGRSSSPANTIPASGNARTAAAAPSASTARTPGGSGLSWGPKMPDEENQFNYPGTYTEYFQDVFTGAFPDYRITNESVRRGKAAVFTFWNGEQRALVVEVMSENSCAQRICADCAREGIPYLRFYYNHFGWWNTKSYVIGRAKKALGA